MFRFRHLLIPLVLLLVACFVYLGFGFKPGTGTAQASTASTTTTVKTSSKVKASDSNSIEKLRKSGRGNCGGIRATEVKAFKQKVIDYRNWALVYYEADTVHFQLDSFWLDSLAYPQKVLMATVCVYLPEANKDTLQTYAFTYWQDSSKIASGKITQGSLGLESEQAFISNHIQQ